MTLESGNKRYNYFIKCYFLYDDNFSKIPQNNEVQVILSVFKVHSLIDFFKGK